MKTSVFPFKCVFAVMGFYYEASICLMGAPSSIIMPRQYQTGRYYKPGRREWLRDEVATMGLSLKNLSPNEENAVARWFLKAVPWEDLNKRQYFDALASALGKIGADLRGRDGLLECYKRYRTCTAKCVGSKVLPRKY